MRRLSRSFCRLIAGLTLLALLGGCAVLDSYIPASAPSITAEEESRLGVAVEKRLLQMLGGRHQDQELSVLMMRLGNRYKGNVTIVDKSSAEFYSLPGRRVILTRGLLMRVETLNQVEALLQDAVSRSRTLMINSGSRALSRAVQEFLADKTTIYNPDAADIRIAGFFADSPCSGACLNEAIQVNSGQVKSLTKPFVALKGTRPGFELMEKARALEKSGEQAESISVYLQAATIAPDQARILCSLGMAYLRAGDLQAARLHLQKANELQPNYYKTLMGLGYVYMQTNKIDKAKRALAESVRFLPVTENLFLLAEATEKAGERDEAISLYEIVVDNDRYSKLGRAAKSRLLKAKVN